MEFLQDLNAVIRYISLPNTVKGFTVFDSENDFYNIFINQKLSYHEQRKAVLHEIKHITKGDFKSSCERNINDIEWEMAQ